MKAYLPELDQLDEVLDQFPHLRPDNDPYRAKQSGAAARTISAVRQCSG
jgi:hypothetical protein